MLKRVAPEKINAQLAELANQAREWTLAYAKTTDDSEVDEDDLCGGCAITAGRLFELMQAAGFTDMCIALNDMHVFIVWRSGDQEIIIDPTAGQIKGCAPVEFFIRAPIPRVSYDLDWWRVFKRVTSTADLVAYQIRREWPEGQISPIKV